MFVYWRLFIGESSGQMGRTIPMPCSHEHLDFPPFVPRDRHRGEGGLRWDPGGTRVRAVIRSIMGTFGDIMGIYPL